MTITTALELEFDLADYMRKALRASGIGVGEMAERLEVSRNTVSRWINGDAQPRWRDLKSFANECGVDPVWIDPAGVVRPKGLEPLTF